ncbi:acyl carrier protein [Schleiferiaceae bacterium]|jgi:acyl carrier protein|nr:acyl carrier protein [Schleiferiaceae bacterium]
MKAEIEDFRLILCEVLEREIESLTIMDAPKDVDGWDSLNHVYLIIKLESHYNIKFNTSKVQKWSCIDDILRDINSLT